MIIVHGIGKTASAGSAWAQETRRLIDAESVRIPRNGTKQPLGAISPPETCSSSCQPPKDLKDWIGVVCDACGREQDFPPDTSPLQARLILLTQGWAPGRMHGRLSSNASLPDICPECRIERLVRADQARTSSREAAIRSIAQRCDAESRPA